MSFPFDTPGRGGPRPHRGDRGPDTGERRHGPHHHPHHGERAERVFAHHPGRGGFPGGPGGGFPGGRGGFPGPFPFPGGPRGERGFGRRRGGRAQRGDVRTAVLLLLAEEPMHGYQLMQAIAERSDGAWRPSPGAIYPTISQLEDEGLVDVTPTGGRRLVTLTDAGRAHVEEHRGSWGDPFAGLAATGADGPDLRGLLGELMGAVGQVAAAGSEAQVAAAATVLADARRAVYLLLADGPAAPGGPAGAPGDGADAPDPA